MGGLPIAAFLLAATLVWAQPQSGISSSATVKQVMLDLSHPASNDILLLVNRGGPAGEKDWAAIRRAALTLAESGNLLMAPGRGRNDPLWRKDAQALADAGGAAYKAGQAKDGKALAAVAGPLDHSCTACHRDFRPNVFPRPGDSP